jgi:toxin ParE1/3/4
MIVLDGSEAERPRSTAPVDHYLSEAGPDVTRGFIGAPQSAYRAVGERPSLGSPRYAQELAFPGLGSRALKGYPCLVFTIERDDHIDVWRVLHARRDIPSRMWEP